MKIQKDFLILLICSLIAAALYIYVLFYYFENFSKKDVNGTENVKVHQLRIG